MNAWDKMTWLSKALIIIVLIGGVIGGVYALGGDDFIKKNITPTSSTTSNSEAYADLDDDEKENVLKVCVNTWAGYSGLAYANNGFAPNKESIFYKKYGILVELVHMDGFDDSRNAWKSGNVDVLWGTLDAFPTEVNGLAELKPRAFVNVDWSRGGDVIVAKRGVISMNDLRGKKVAFAPKAPSHSMLLMALKASNMVMKDIQAVEVPDAIEAAKLFMAGEVDAAVTWSPNDQECLNAVKGSQVVISTKTLSSAIADVFYAKEDYINTHQDLLKNFVYGLMDGNAAVNSDPKAKETAKDLLSKGFDLSRGFFDTTINKAYLCTYGDNYNFFGLNATFGGIAGDDLYDKMTMEFAKIGAAPSKVPSSREILYVDFIQNAPAEIANAPTQKAEGEVKFTAPTKAEETATAFSDKKVTITFLSGSSELTVDAQNTIDKEFADIAKSFRSARIRIAGNTDNTGSDAVNVPLSKARAQAVANYLISNYNFPSTRFVVIGNGSKHPVAPNTTEDGKSANRRTDFQLIANNEDAL